MIKVDFNQVDNEGKLLIQWPNHGLLVGDVINIEDIEGDFRCNAKVVYASERSNWVSLEYFPGSVEFL